MNDNADRSFAADVELQDGLIILKFARPTTRLVLTPQIARVFASCLLLRAEELDCPFSALEDMVGSETYNPRKPESNLVLLNGPDSRTTEPRRPS